MMRFLLAVPFICLTLVLPAKADTTYTHYELRGRDALEIMREISRRGPNVHGESAIASINARMNMRYDFQRNGEMCRPANFRVVPTFEIRLPRLLNEAELDAETRRAWVDFYNQAKWHEEEHRRIYLGCITDLERQIRAMPAVNSCNALEAAVRREYDRNQVECRARHLAFDQAEAKRFPRLPMVQQAMGVARQYQEQRAMRIEEAPQMPDWFFDRATQGN